MGYSQTKIILQTDWYMKFLENVKSNQVPIETKVKYPDLMTDDQS